MDPNPYYNYYKCLSTEIKISVNVFKIDRDKKASETHPKRRLSEERGRFLKRAEHFGRAKMSAN